MRRGWTRIGALLKAGVGLGLGCGLVLGVSGCRPTPRVVTLTDLDTDAKRSDLAPEYWIIESRVLGEGSAQTPAVLAITGFEVEFITSKRETPLDNQPVFGMTPITPISLGIELTGIGRKTVRFDEPLQETITSMLREKVLELYDIKGVMVLGPEAVRGTKAYGQFRTAELESSGVLQAISFVGTDTGTIRDALVRPAPGQALITGTVNGKTVEQVEREILEELGADTAVQVRVRVGIYRGLASIERGSRAVFVHRNGGRSTAVSQRSILGNINIEAGTSFSPLYGDVHEVDPELYLSQLSGMMEPYLAMMNWVVVRDRETGGRLGARPTGAQTRAEGATPMPPDG